MSNSFTRSFRRSIIGGVALAALMPAFAMAQDAPAEEEAAPKDEIVVTGTLIRGIAPPGANVISASAADIKASGATTVAQLLQTIPQLGSFGSLQTLQAVSADQTVNRPNLRSLPGFNTAGGSTTLVLMDGHRMVGMGNTTTSPDPDVIPAGAIERLEIVPDGGSAIYGSDAVAGVMNFITLKRFDGVKVDANIGFADSYYRYDANITAGTDWGSGSAFVSYAYAKGDQLVGADRDYIRQFPDNSGGTERQCSPGNIVAGGVNYKLPGGAAGYNLCDASDYASVYPAYQKHNVLVGLTQQLSDSIELEVKGYYAHRDTEVLSGPFRFTTGTIPVGQIPAAYVGLGASQTVNGTFGANDAAQSQIKLDTWGITPTITAQLGGNFRLRVLGSYGKSVSLFRNQAGINQTAMTNLIAAGLFNPYNPGSITPLAYSEITNTETYGRTVQQLANVRAIIDGDLFELPGGTVKVAFGGEYSHETFQATNGSTARGTDGAAYAGTTYSPAVAAIPTYNLSRNVKSVFGEIVAPIFGNGGPSLTVSAAGRYDYYSDVKGTFNPRFGATFKPVDWISVHGAWGKSFNAPSLADLPGAAQTTTFMLNSFFTGPFRPPAALVTNGTYPAFQSGGVIVAIRGNAPGIQPQKATTWTLGVDFTPPVVEGLRFGVTYYNISVSNLIQVADFGNPQALYTSFNNLISTNPDTSGNTLTQAMVDAAFAADSDGQINVNSGVVPLSSVTIPTVGTGSGQVYAFFDARKTNLGGVKVAGVDFHVDYQANTGFGKVFFSLNGSRDLKNDQAVNAGAPFVDQIPVGQNVLRMRTSVGAEVGSFLGQVIWNHRGGYTFSIPQGFVGVGLDGVTYTGQTEIGSFNTVDLFFRYDMKGSGMAKDLSFTMNVQNLFDQAPPLYVGSSQPGVSGIRNGNTVGRYVQFGLSKRF